MAADSDELELDFDDGNDSEPELELEVDNERDDDDREEVRGRRRRRRSRRDDDDSDDELDDVELDDEEDEGEERPKRKRSGGALAALRGRPKRPGEQDPMQSPLVMWLFGGSVALVLVSAILWLVIGRYYRQEAYDAAKTEFDARRYRQAITLYEGFLVENSSGNLADAARLDLARAKVLRHIDTATPDWEDGIEEFDAFLVEYRDRSIFEEELKPEAFEYAKKIALGTAREAERSEVGDLLPIHDRAAPLALRFAPVDEKDDLETSLEEALARAKQAIHRRETYDAAMADIQQSLDGGDPLAALDRRIALLDQFADYAGDTELAARFDAALDAEIARIVVTPVGVPGETAEPDDLVTGPTLALHTRNSEDQPVGTRRVIAVAGGACFGADATTGTPIWMRRLGTDQPFFPVETRESAAGLLAFDTRRLELVHFDRGTGDLLWRTPIGEPVAHEPLVSRDGLVYLTTTSGAIHQLGLEDGELIASARCPQPLVTTPTSLDDGRIVVAGDRNLAYVFGTRPFEIESIVHLGQRMGTMSEIVAMGPYVLTVENDQHAAARLRLFASSLDGRQPSPVGDVRVPGLVHDPVAVRGSQLVVPFGAERIATFVVSAEEGKPTILQTGMSASAGGEDVDSYLLAGPADEFWVASTALRRYRIQVETIQQVPGDTARGLHTQPIQSIGEDVFIGHRPPYAAPVYFVRLNRRTFTGEWRAVLGDRIAATLPQPNGSLVCATESGQVFRVTADDLEKGGFVSKPTFTVPLGEKVNGPLRVGASADGIGFVGTDREGKDRLWVVNRVGVLDWTVELPATPVLPPAPLGDGFVIAYPGRLSLVLRTRARIDDYQSNVAPGSETKWVGLGALGKDAVVAQDSEGGLVKIAYEPRPLPHLSPVATIEGAGRTTVPFGASTDVVATVDGDNTLLIRSSNRFEELANLPLGAAAARPAEVVGNLVLVETRDHVLHGLRFGLGARPPWQLPLAGGSLAGKPLLAGNDLVVVLRDGRVLVVDPLSGEMRNGTSLPAEIAGGPLSVGEKVVIPTGDASLIPIDVTAGAQ